MAEILSSPLKVLDRLYRFVAYSGPRQVELGLPIQLVHDVSRSAELGREGMGYFIAGQDSNHAGAGVIESTFDPYTHIPNLIPNSAEHWAWMVAGWGTASTALMTQASLALGYAPVGNYIVRRDRPLLMWDSTTTIYDQAVAPANHPYALLLNDTRTPMLHPVLFPPGSLARITSTASGVVVSRIEGLFWYGPMGSLPPEAG